MIRKTFKGSDDGCGDQSQGVLGGRTRLQIHCGRVRTYAQEQGGTRWEITKRRQGSGSGGCPCGFQPLGHVRLCDSMWTVARQAPLSPGVCSDSCPLSWRCQPAISSSVVLFSSCPQSFPASAAFPASWLSHQVAKGLEFQL